MINQISGMNYRGKEAPVFFCGTTLAGQSCDGITRASNAF